MFHSLLATSRRHAFVLIPLALLLVSACGIVWYSRVSVAASIAHIGTPTSIGANATSDADSGYERGDRVRHAKFGEGRVVSVDGNKLTVQFDSGGEKKVIAAFLQRAE